MKEAFRSSSAIPSPSAAAFDLSKIALLLDVDGTLLDIAPEPEGVHVPGELRDVLREISESEHGAMALVSGRPIAQLDRLFAPLKLALIGCHGAEVRRSPGGPVHRHPPLNGEIRHGLFVLAAEFPAAVVEDKQYAIAFHYRKTPALEAPLGSAVKAFVAAHPGLELFAGKSVFEVKSSGYDKATACAGLLMHPPFLERTPVFLGDDVTDERVFRKLPEYAGIGISVGRPMAGAQYMLPTPASVRGWLHELVTGKKI